MHQIRNILSLFDGMSCGQIALNRAGIIYSNYYASEIDKNAIKITLKNFPKTIQIGDVTKINFKSLPKIDLLIGGSPCQGFSKVGKELNFEDPRSKLFFEFHRALKETNPKYFLLENVHMKQEFQDVISEYMGVKPIEINSNLVSCQNRRRLYWTNIKDIKQPEDKNVKWSDISEDGWFAGTMRGRRINKLGQRDDYNKDIPLIQFIESRKDDKTNTLTTVIKDNIASEFKVGRTPLDEVNWRYLTPNECERLQTIDVDYTYGVPKSHRYKMLGNGWTVDVIAHIFKGIKQ
jgi:site-specific DNA-cytosine methylase